MLPTRSTRSSIIILHKRWLQPSSLKRQPDNEREVARTVRGLQLTGVVGRETGRAVVTERQHGRDGTVGGGGGQLQYNNNKYMRWRLL